MADRISNTSASGDIRLQQGPHNSAALRTAPAQAQFIFRGGADARSAVAAALGFALPITACRAARSGGRAALWLGPDEWLLLAPLSETTNLATALASDLASLPHSLVGVSHRAIPLLLSGPDAATLLNAGCPLDLAETAFPIGMCTRTILAKAPIILWRTTPQCFYVSAWRSFAPYVWDYLIEARTRL